MAQTATGKLTEYRVLKRLKDLGLAPVKPFPDRGVDIEVRSQNNPERIIKIQVKGRYPKKVKTWRWFQIRVTPRKLLEAKGAGLDLIFTLQSLYLLVLMDFRSWLYVLCLLPKKLRNFFRLAPLFALFPLLESKQP